MTVAKKNYLYFHIIAMLLLIIGFNLAPAKEPITPFGMRCIGVFLAMLWGWSTCGLLWPSLLGMICVAALGEGTMSAFLANSFGNETIVFILFIFIFTGVIDEVGLIDYIANLFISFKILNNRPWIFSTLVLIAAYISAAFINMFAAVIVFWSIIYIVSDKFGFQKYDKWPTLMLIGVILASSVGGAVMPYKPVPMVALKAYSEISGTGIDYFNYICFSLPTTFFIMLVYVMVCRFVFRPDLKDLKNISTDFADKSKLVLSVKQKTAIAFLAVFIFLMIAPSILPESWMLTILIKKLGVVGCLFILLIIMHWIHFDGRPLLEFDKMAKHINWDMFLIMAFVIPFAAIFTGDATGIKPFIVSVMNPILAGRAPLVFLLLALTIATILTNVANNMVVAAVFTTLIYTIAGSMGMDVMPIIAVLIICANLALATPAASPLAAMMFANTKWLKPAMLYRLCILTVLLLMIFTMSIGLLYAQFIY